MKYKTRRTKHILKDLFKFKFVRRFCNNITRNNDNSKSNNNNNFFNCAETEKRKMSSLSFNLKSKGRNLDFEHLPRINANVPAYSLFSQ